MGLIKMPSKRRNNGRSKKNKGHSNTVVCCQSGRLVPKDKAIKRFQIKKIVDESSRKDIMDNSAYADGQFHLPKMYQKLYYSISCAIHSRVVRVRSAKRGDRRTRYTTKIRKTNIAEARTGGFAKVAPQLAKSLKRDGTFRQPRTDGPKPVATTPAPEGTPTPGATTAA